MNLKIKNKRKFLRSVIILFTVIFILFIGINQTYSKVEIKYKESYIFAGDTLWSIATQELKNNKYYENKDIRLIIQEIKYINNLQNSELKEGQKIKIPTI